VSEKVKTKKTNRSPRCCTSRCGFNCLL